MLCTTRKDSESEWLAKDNPETNPITIKPMWQEQFSWVPLTYCSPPGCPFPVKSLALSAHVSPRTIHFPSVRQEPSFGPWKGSPFLQQNWSSFPLRLTHRDSHQHQSPGRVAMNRVGGHLRVQRQPGGDGGAMVSVCVDTDRQHPINHNPTPPSDSSRSRMDSN